MFKFKYKLNIWYWLILIFTPLGVASSTNWRLSHLEFYGIYVGLIIAGILTKIYGYPKHFVKTEVKTKIKEDKSQGILKSFFEIRKEIINNLKNK